MHRLLCMLWLMLSCSMLPSICAAQVDSFGLSLPPSLNFATSPSPVGSGARAAGKAFAFIAVADDATAASHNPGGLVQLERPEVSVVGSYLARLERQDVTQPGTVVENQSLDSVHLNYLSAAYPLQILRRNVVVSLNVQRLFDFTGATKVASRFTTVEGIQRVQSRQEGGLWTISPALAVQITPTFSLGMAVNIWPDLFANGWDQQVTVQGEGRLAKGNQIVPFVSNGRIREDFRFRGVNVTAGFLWAINQTFTLGGVLRSPFTAAVRRQHASSLTFTLQDGSAPQTTALNFREKLDMDMPLSYGLGFSARLSKLLSLSLDVSRTHWSDFQFELGKSTRAATLLVENGAPAGKGRAVLNGQSDNTTSVRLGAEYLWIRSPVVIPFRGGFFYDPEPGDRGTDAFFGLSLGTGLVAGPLLLDVAYLFRTGTVASSATDTRVQQHTVLASVIYHF